MFDAFVFQAFVLQTLPFQICTCLGPYFLDLRFSDFCFSDLRFFRLFTFLNFCLFRFLLFRLYLVQLFAASSFCFFRLPQACIFLVLRFFRLWFFCYYLLTFHLLQFPQILCQFKEPAFDKCFKPSLFELCIVKPVPFQTLVFLIFFIFLPFRLLSSKIAAMASSFNSIFHHIYLTKPSDKIIIYVYIITINCTLVRACSLEERQ